MGCNNCAGRRAGVKYEVKPGDGSPVVRVDTVTEARMVVSEKGGTYKAVAA
jgi:flagellar biosynthesis/type III secretory pathway M-ring protein FliF/YscJ